MLKQNIKNTHSLNDIKISTVYSGIKNKSSKEDDLLLIEFANDANISGIFTKFCTND